MRLPPDTAGRAARRLLVAAASVVLAGGLAPAAPAGAMDVAPCEEPVIFSGAAVNALILPFRDSGAEAGSELPEAGERLARLVQLEVLLSLVKYGSVGAVVLHESEPGSCDPLEVLQQVELRPGHGLLMIRGRLFEQEGKVYVQTYVRFLRGERDEEIRFDLEGSDGVTFPFSARLPASALAFAPRRLERSDLDRIEVEFEEATTVRSAPRADAPGQPLAMDPRTASAFSVTETRDGWMRVAERGGEQEGWLRGRTAGDWSLADKLPELALIDAIAGYLRLRAGLEPGVAPAPPHTPAWARRAIAVYREHAGAAGSEMAEATGSVLEGLLELYSPRPDADRGPALERAAAHFRRAAERVPFDSAARNLAALPLVAGYAFGADDPDRVRGAVATMLDAVSLDPENDEPLANLESCYGWLRQRETARPTWSAEELTRRLAQVRELRGEQ